MVGRNQDEVALEGKEAIPATRGSKRLISKWMGLTATKQHAFICCRILGNLGIIKGSVALQNKVKILENFSLYKGILQVYRNLNFSTLCCRIGIKFPIEGGT